MEIKRVMVLGAGQMGAGITQVAAQAGYEVVVGTPFARKNDSQDENDQINQVFTEFPHRFR